MMLEMLCVVVFPGAMVFAGVMDLFTMTIPNRISLVLVAGFLALAPLLGFDLEQIAMHLAAGAVVLLIAIAFFAKGWIGGGDAKIFAAASLWLGFEFMPQFLLISTLAGGALTLLLLFFRKFPLPAVLLQQKWIDRLHDHRTGVPYGIAIAYAALVVYPTTPWVTWVTG